MNEKKVENIHTKPRGKGQCSPEQTCPEVPLVLYRFLILIDVYLSLWTKWQKKKTTLTNPIKFSCLYLPVFIYFIYFILKQENVISVIICILIIRYHIPYRGKVQSLCVYMFIYIFIYEYLGDFSHSCVNTQTYFLALVKGVCDKQAIYS